MRKKQESVAIDIDDVLADLHPLLNVFYNRTHGTNFRVEDYRHYDLEKTWGGTKEEADAVIEAFFKSPDFLEISPILYSIEGVEYLGRKKRIFSVTSRPESIQRETNDFIKRNYGNYLFRVFYTGQHNVAASKINKLNTCVERGADILIEDCLETAISCAEGGIDVLLFDAPWNQLNGNGNFRLPGNLTRVKNWLEILEILK